MSKIDEQFYNDFVDTLHGNEDCMGEHAAFSVTCQMMDIEEMDAYEMMIKYGEELNNDR